jgi:hypothetical protein
LGSGYGHFQQEPTCAAIGRESKNALHLPEPPSLPGSQRDAQDYKPGDVQITYSVPQDDHL